MAMQDSRHRGPDESRDAMRVCRLKASTATMNLPCYKKDTLKASLKDFDGGLGTDCTQGPETLWVLLFYVFVLLCYSVF